MNHSFLLQALWFFVGRVLAGTGGSEPHPEDDCLVYELDRIKFLNDGVSKKRKNTSNSIRDGSGSALSKIFITGWVNFGQGCKAWNKMDFWGNMAHSALSRSSSILSSPLCHLSSFSLANNIAYSPCNFSYSALTSQRDDFSDAISASLAATVRPELSEEPREREFRRFSGLYSYSRRSKFRGRALENIVVGAAWGKESPCAWLTVVGISTWWSWSTLCLNKQTDAGECDKNLSSWWLEYRS